MAGKKINDPGNTVITNILTTDIIPLGRTGNILPLIVTSDNLLKPARDYADSLVTGLWNDRGNYDASVNTYPASGGSGVAGAIKKGDIWTVSVAGTLGGVAVAQGDTVRALVNSPGQTSADWAIGENNIGYVPENVANKEVAALDTSTTKYPCNNVVKVAVDGKQPLNSSKINFSFGDASPVNVMIAEASQLIETVKILILTPFDGVGVALKVGDSGQFDRLFTKDQIDPTYTGTFEANPNHIYGVQTQILLSITPGDGATQGSGLLIINYKL